MAHVARLAATGIKVSCRTSADKLRAEADYADQIARSATDRRKRELYERLAAHFKQLAGEIEKAMAEQRGDEPPPPPPTR
jgi:hypothetical protein